ncbi:hypothetical protein [Montanilutibacter psychrotolerans]|uniref:Uncharacterized protein n=1 Tax=Montanilutibacter psychrotolerans TaxID=1327343 RepID=A0A3M8SRG1_9GAMM|nr:hypothetical protein [Lysobacter psychrotolerans]RNF83285.1 hypothetical protein EER27_12395 [Lysobacter psychrotolerans]
MRSASPLNRALSVGLLALATIAPWASRGAPSDAATFDVRQFVCPLSGETFSQDVGYAAMPLVQFADGSWLGDHLVDAQIPECPRDGLVLIPDYANADQAQSLPYLEYSLDQLMQLHDLLGSDAYRKLRHSSRHERAQWLATQLGMPAQTRMQLLVRASWATTDRADRRRLVTRIADEGPTLIEAFTTPEAEKRTARLLVANALREMGRFADANTLLDSMLASIPADANVTDPDNTQALVGTISGLQEAIAHRDDDRFPVDLSSAKWAASVCNGGDLPPPYGPITTNAKAACERRQRDRQSREDSLQETIRLGETPEELERQCRTTPAGQQTPGLARACELAQGVRDERVGHELVVHQARQVAADCEATPAQERNGPLGSACFSYETALQFALANVLIDDNAAYAIICADDELPEDRAGFATLACSTAQSDRLDRAIEKLLAAPASLDAACAATPERDRGLELNLACHRRHSELWQARVDRLAADPAAYDTACAKIDTRTVDAPREGEYDDVLCDDARRARERSASAQARVAAESNEPSGEKPSQDDERPQVDVFAPDSDLSKVALEYAQRVVDKAKAEGTYPKRKRGDLF